MNAKFALPHTGKPPIEVHGWLVTEGSSFDASNLDRGYTLAIYRNDERTQLFAHLTYYTRWAFETQTDTVFVAKDAEELGAAMLAYDPLTHVVGYPPGKQFVEKQDRLRKWLTLEYQALISRVLAVIAQTLATQDAQKKVAP
jgi:hypothetical protein